MLWFTLKVTFVTITAGGWVGGKELIIRLSSVQLELGLELATVQLELDLGLEPGKNNF
jgi:hypothetical protein